MGRSFRIVAALERAPDVLALLEAEGFASAPLPFSPLCREFTVEPVSAGASLAAFFGYIYIQDRASMLPPLALDPPEGAAALDMCASPGGKALFLGQLCGENGFTLANEPPGSRLSTLRANVLRSSLPQVATCVYDGKKIPLRENSLSHILLDAPCSGWGTAKKNPRAPKIWRGKKLNALLGLQRALLNRAIDLLAPGGRLLYSTCTTNPDENDGQIIRALEERDVTLAPLAPFAGFHFQAGLDGALRVDGAASSSQGFYLALLRKKGSDTEPLSNENSQFKPMAPSNTVDMSDLLLLPSGSRAALFGETVRFIPKAAPALLPAKFIWQGYPLGKMRNGRLFPEPRLHDFIRADAAPILRLDAVEDIRALLAGRGKNTGLSAPFACLFWRNLPLGFVVLKNGRAISAFR